MGDDKYQAKDLSPKRKQIKIQSKVNIHIRCHFSFKLCERSNKPEISASYMTESAQYDNKKMKRIRQFKATESCKTLFMWSYSFLPLVQSFDKRDDASYYLYCNTLKNQAWTLTPQNSKYLDFLYVFQDFKM